MLHDLCIVVVQYPISFALNLAIPTDKVIGAKQVYCASATLPAKDDNCTAVKDTGTKSDEADAELLKVSAAASRNYCRCQNQLLYLHFVTVSRARVQVIFLIVLTCALIFLIIARY